MSTDTYPFDIYEKTQAVGSEMTLWLMMMHSSGYATLDHGHDSVAHMCEFGEDFDHEWDTPVTLHYALGWPE